MRITGSKRLGNRKIEVDGKKYTLHEKDYDLGRKAAIAGKSPDCIYGFSGCPASFAAGYTDCMEKIAKQVQSQGGCHGFMC